MSCHVVSGNQPQDLYKFSKLLTYRWIYRFIPSNFTFKKKFKNLSISITIHFQDSPNENIWYRKLKHVFFCHTLTSLIKTFKYLHFYEKEERTFGGKVYWFPAVNALVINWLSAYQLWLFMPGVISTLLPCFFT